MSILEDLSEKRGPGRPSKNVEMKKGNSTWRPANVDDVFDKEPGYRYRKINKDPRNLARKQAEGWEIISDVAGKKTEMEGGYGRINDGKPLTSVREGFDYVLGRIPEELALQRDAYMNGETARRTASLKRQTEKDLGGAPTHGSITIEKKGVRTIIKD